MAKGEQTQRRPAQAAEPTKAPTEKGLANLANVDAGPCSVVAVDAPSVVVEEKADPTFAEAGIEAVDWHRHCGR